VYIIILALSLSFRAPPCRGYFYQSPLTGATTENRLLGVRNSFIPRASFKRISRDGLTNELSMPRCNSDGKEEMRNGATQRHE